MNKYWWVVMGFWSALFVLTVFLRVPGVDLSTSILFAFCLWLALLVGMLLGAGCAEAGIPKWHAKGQPK